MKKLVPSCALILLLSACGDEGRQAERDVDQVLNKVEEKAEVLADSAKEKYKYVRDHLDTALDRKSNESDR